MHADWPQRRADLLAQLDEATARRRRAEREGASSAEVDPLQSEESALRREYAQALPQVTIARDPIGGELVAVHLDPAGIDAPYWDTMSPARPFETLPPTYVVHSGAMTLDESVIDDSQLLRVPGPAVPYVVPELLGRGGVRATLARVGVGPHTGYVVTYFSPRGYEPEPLTNEWGTNRYWLRRDGVPVSAGEAYEGWPAPDFDLAPWIERGALSWVAPDDAGWTLRDEVAGCPFVDLPGRREHQHVQNGKVW